MRDYVDDCSANNVALTETWLGDEDNASVSELCTDTAYTSIKQYINVVGIMHLDSARSGQPLLELLAHRNDAQMYKKSIRGST